MASALNLPSDLGDHHAWFLLSRPDIWDLREAVETCDIGDTETWGVPKSGIRETVQIGDPVVLYQAGSDPAIRALGEVATLPHEVPLRERKKIRADGEQREHEWIVDIKYTHFLERPVLKSDLLADPILANLNGIKARGGTSFWIEPEQWQRLAELIDAKQAGQSTPNEQRLATPFNKIFTSWNEAWWAFDFARESLTSAGVTSADDPLLSATLPKGENQFHVNYGHWLLAGFYSPHKAYRVAIPLLRDRRGLTEVTRIGTFEGQPDRDVVDLCGLTLEQAQHPTVADRAAIELTLAEGRERFSAWSATPHTKGHNPVLAEAIFDEDVRRMVLAEGPSDASAWDAYVSWAARILTEPGFLETRELTYKRQIAATMSVVREALLAGDATWPEALGRALRGRDQNIVDYRAAEPARAWANESSNTLGEALRALWNTPSPGAAEYVAYFDAVPQKYKQARSNSLLSLFMMGIDPKVYPPYRATSFSVAYDKTGFALRSRSDYEKALRFCDRLIREARDRGVEIDDRLVAQSLVFCIEQISKGWHPESFDANDVQALIDYREGKTMPDFYNFVRDDQGFHFPDWLITDYVLALTTKPFVILSGISGTGKTKIAQFLAEYLAPDYSVAVPKTDEPPIEDGQFLHKVGASTLKYRGLTVPMAAIALLPVVPDRGTGVPVAIEVEGAGSFSGRINHVGYSDSSRGTMLGLSWHTDLSRWMSEHAEIGDYLVCEPNDDEHAPAVKIRLVKSQEETVTRVSGQRAFMSVRADWTDNRQLLGYFNPLLGEYVPTELLKLLLRAMGDPDKPYFVVLDEMNLAKVEYYFSDFLSAMEGDEQMILHDAGGDLTFNDDDDTAYVIPERLAVPPNVFFTGTVNVDETTYMFSPKVLDRANVIEFNEVHLPTSSSRPEDLHPWRLEKADAEALTATLMRYVPTGENGLKHRNPLPADWAALNAQLQQVVIELNATLHPDHLHFGYRVANEMARFINTADEFTDAADAMGVLDIQVLQKVLPKLSGSRARLEAPLKRLLEHATTHSLKRSSEKIERMLKTLEDVGFVSFVE